MITANAIPHPLERDLSAEEREAYQRGDYRTAEILGYLLDIEESRSEEEERLQEQLDEAERNYSNAQEGWAEHRIILKEKTQSLRLSLEGESRITRKQLIAALDELDDAIDEPAA